MFVVNGGQQCALGTVGDVAQTTTTIIGHEQTAVRLLQLQLMPNTSLRVLLSSDVLGFLGTWLVAVG